jgi:hypothetical protein
MWSYDYISESTEISKSVTKFAALKRAVQEVKIGKIMTSGRQLVSML